MVRLLRLTKTLRLNQADFRFAKFNLLRLRLAKDLFEPGPGHNAQSAYSKYQIQAAQGYLPNQRSFCNWYLRVVGAGALLITCTMLDICSTLACMNQHSNPDKSINRLTPNHSEQKRTKIPRCFCLHLFSS